MKKNKKFIIIICIAILIGFTYSFLLKRYKGNINNVINDVTSGYIDYYTEEFLNEIEEYDEESINLFYVYQKSKYLNDSFKNNTCYKINGISPSIYIYTYDNVGMSLEKEDNYVGCDVVYIDEFGEISINKESKVKVRGNSTATLDKKPYTIKFSEKQNLIGAGEAKKWNLLAEAFDPTMLRNNTFLTLAETMELPYTAKHQYVEVYMDSSYAGCYLLTEAVEVGKERVDLDLDNKDFFIEFESWKVEDGVYYFEPRKDIRVALKEPEEPTDEQLEYYEDTINKLVDVLFSNNYEELCKYYDVDSFAKYYLLNEFAKTADIAQSSVNFYFKDGKLYAGPVWDFDLSSGNTERRVYPTYWHTIKGKEIAYLDYFCRQENPVFRQLCKYKEFVELYKKYFEKYKNELTNIYEDGGFIDSTLEKYKPLIDRNYNNTEDGGIHWGVSARQGYLQVTPLDTYDENLNYFKEFLKNRFEWLSDNN